MKDGSFSFSWHILTSREAFTNNETSHYKLCYSTCWYCLFEEHVIKWTLLFTIPKWPVYFMFIIQYCMKIYTYLSVHNWTSVLHNFGFSGNVVTTEKLCKKLKHCCNYEWTLALNSTGCRIVEWLYRKDQNFATNWIERILKFTNIKV